MASDLDAVLEEESLQAEIVEESELETEFEELGLVAYIIDE